MAMLFPFRLRDRRGICSFLVVLFILFAHLAFLSSRAAAQTADGQYKVGTGDVLSIVVYGDEALSGDYPVAPDGTIAYPVLGNVSVTGLSPAEIGGRIGKSLAEYIPGLTVTAAVAQYAPVFLIGDVEKPGQYEYRPGMIAIELVAVGGGVRRGLGGLENGQLQIIAAQQEYADLALQIYALEARRARLEAEFHNRDHTFPSPAAGTDPATREARQRIIDGEKTLFDIRKNTLRSEGAALAAQEESYRDEIEQLTASIELHQNEIRLLSEDVASTRDLAERGLTAKSNLREVERRLSAAHRDALELGSFLARARQSELALRQRRQALVETRANEAARAIQEADLELARMRTKQRYLLQTMSEAALTAGGPIAPRIGYKILRSVDGEYQEIEASERSAIMPGDILQSQLIDTSEMDAPETTGALQENAGETRSSVLSQRR